MAFGAKLTAVSDYLFRRLFKVLFRYDIFISYARRDGKGYALKLKEQLTRLDFSCFLDYDELPAGNSLNRTLRRAVKRSATIIVVGTEGALKSRYVELEVGEFARTGRAIIPIDFEGTLADAPWPVVKERDLVWVDETKDALAKNTPSPPVADAVDKLFKYTRRNVRVRGQVIATAALFLLGAAISVLVIQRQVAAANEQKHQAEVAKGQAQQEQGKAEAAAANARRQEALAKESADRAKQKEQEAKEKTEEARKQGEIARTQTAEAQKQATIARAKAEEARRQQQLAEEQQKLASSRELAANAMSQLQIDPELSLVLAGKSAEAAHTLEAEDALRRSLLESHVRAVMEGNRGEVSRASFTPDGEFAVTAGDDNTARVLRLSDGQVVAELRGHTKPLRDAALSPDGTMVVTAGDDNVARVWDWRANRVMLELPHPAAVSGARFSPDGAAIVTTSDDNAARVWDAKTGRRLSPVLYGVEAKLSDHSVDSVTIKPLNPDGRHIFFVSAEDEGERNRLLKNDTALYGVRQSVWDVSAGRILPGLENELDAVFSADVNVEQKLMITNGKVLWDLRTGRRFAELREPNDKRVNGVALSPDGKFVVTAHSDNTARVWAVPENRQRGAEKTDAEGEGQVVDAPLWVLSGHRGTVRSAAFSPDSRFILTASDDRTARVWDVKTGREVTVLRGHRRGVLSAAFSLDGRRMITSGYDGVARVWDAGMGHGFVELGGQDEVESATFAARSKLVLTTDDKQTVRVWDAGTGQRLPHAWPGRVAALSPDGKVIVTAKQESPRIYDAATGRVREELTDQEVMAYSPDGRFFASAWSDKVVRVRDAETGKVVKELPLPAGAVTPFMFSPGAGDFLWIGALAWEWKTERPPAALTDFGRAPLLGAFSPDGRLAARPRGNTVAVWDTRTGCRLKVLMRHKSLVISVAFGPDGRSLLSVDPYAAKLWQLPATLKCDGAEVSLKESLALDHAKTGSFAKEGALLSPDGQFIVLTGSEGVQVHDAHTGAIKFKLGDGAARTRGAALSPDGKLIVTASADGDARVWDSGTGSLLRTLKGRSDVPLNATSFSPDGKLIVTVSDPRFNVVAVWDAGTGRRLGENLRGQSASFSPDSKSVLTVSGGDVGRVSDVSAGRAVAELQELSGAVTHLAFGDDGQRIVAVTSDRKVGVWEAASGRSLARREYAGDIKTLTLSPDGKRIATTAEGDGEPLGAQVWDTEADKISEFGKDDGVHSVAFSPDGRFVIWTRLDSSKGASSFVTKVSDVVTGDEVKDLAGNLPSFSPDGKRMLTVSGDVASVWEVGTWDIVAELRGHTESINGAAFSPDGRFVVTASTDKTALVWDAATGTLETGLFGDINYGLATAVFSSDGASILVVGRDNTARLYSCVMCGGWDELIARARERFARHPRELTPGEQKKFTSQNPLSAAGARPAALAAP